MKVNGEQLAPSLRTAASFLRATTPEGHLGALLEEPARLEKVLDLVSGLDHVGFIAPAEAAAELNAAAADAGFDGDQHTFASTILARQLAELAGRDSVPTTIFMARGSFSGAGPVAVEVAMPHGVAPELLREWISSGIGTHVAFRVASHDCFGELTRELTADGYRMPAFADGEPLANPSAGLEAVFFDRRPAEPVGLEFCHYS